MQRFKNIGIVIDLKHANSAALSQANYLAHSGPVNIHLICVISDLITQEQQLSINKALRQKTNLDFSIDFLIGTPVVEITRFVVKNNIDLILIEPDKDEDLFNEFFYGSLPLSLIRKAPCPVWIVKNIPSATYQRIAIAVDPIVQDADESKPTITEKLIVMGTAFAKQQSAECYLISAWHLEEEGLYQGPFLSIPQEELDELKNQALEKYAHAFEQLQKKYKEALLGCQKKFLHGIPSHAITQFVVENNIDLLVIGSVAREGIQGFLIGNTAESIINMTNCSIMAIKPDGFISPIAS